MVGSPITDGDRRVLSEAPSGELVDLGDLSNKERVVSPNVIRRLCVGAEAQDLDPRGVWIKNAHVVDPLDLSYCTVAYPLRFEATTFDAILDLTNARLPALRIRTCSLPGLRAIGIRLDDFQLRSSDVTGEVRLLHARITGQLNCAGSTLTNEGGVALSADGAEINGGVVVGFGFSAIGEVRLPRSKIDGQLNCDGATLTNEYGAALLADGAEVNGDVFLRNHFSAEGQVGLVGAQIHGQLDCSGATLINEGGIALAADGAEIEGDVFLRNRFSSTGEVRLNNARIRGQLDCPGATLTNAQGAALSAGRAEIDQVLFWNNFSATGAVQLPGAKIRGDLYCVGASFTNEGGVALFMDGAEIIGDVSLREPFSVNGGVQLVGAKIGGQLDCSGATLANEGDALDGRDATVGRALIFRNVCVTGGVDLTGASATALEDDLGQTDDSLGSWRRARPLVLEGFAYDHFGRNTESDARCRCEWLKHTAQFQQGAWQQLIRVYRAEGRDDEATRVAVAMHNDRVKRAGLPVYRRWGRQVLRAVVGHGYRPWRAGIWAIAIITTYALIVWHWSGMFVPEKQGVIGSPQPAAYAADNVLPIVDLGQAGDWMPTSWVRWVEWSVILLGWSLSTIFVAGFTRIVRS
jgi:hypothetical protein